jgi:hypothetical protein
MLNFLNFDGDVLFPVANTSQTNKYLFLPHQHYVVNDFDLK